MTTLSDFNGPLLLVGAGKMGQAMLDGSSRSLPGPCRR
jgi:pyrroline-5-carboxylate reductase